jgi:hypothetical protein
VFIPNGIFSILESGSQISDLESPIADLGKDDGNYELEIPQLHKPNQKVAINFKIEIT